MHGSEYFSGSIIAVTVCLQVPAKPSGADMTVTVPSTLGMPRRPAIIVGMQNFAGEKRLLLRQMRLATLRQALAKRKDIDGSINLRRRVGKDKATYGHRQHTKQESR